MLMNIISAVHAYTVLYIECTVFLLSASMCPLKSFLHYGPAVRLTLTRHVLSSGLYHHVCNFCLHKYRALHQREHMFSNILPTSGQMWFHESVFRLTHRATLRLGQQGTFTFYFIPVYNNLLARLHIRNCMAWSKLWSYSINKNIIFKFYGFFCRL